MIFFLSGDNQQREIESEVAKRLWSDADTVATHEQWQNQPLWLSKTAFIDPQSNAKMKLSHQECTRQFTLINDWLDKTELIWGNINLYKYRRDIGCRNVNFPDRKQTDRHKPFVFSPDQKAHSISWLIAGERERASCFLPPVKCFQLEERKRIICSDWREISLWEALSHRMSGGNDLDN